MSSVLTIDDYDLPAALERIAAFGSNRFGYIVTPNVDHVIRFHDDEQFRALYSQASFVLLDSRFLAHLMSFMRRKMPRVCLGSDLTEEVMSHVIAPHDPVVLVGGSPAQAEFLRQKFDLRDLLHVNPPMHFINDPLAVEECLRNIEAASPFRFCFLAVGSPQQEILAQRLKERNVARGLALCVGASINFMTGAEKRAPRWMQHAGLEWLYRLLQNPRRMARRYLIRGPRIFFLLPRIQLRSRMPRAVEEVIELAPVGATAATRGGAAPLKKVPTAHIMGRPGQAA